MGQVTGIEFCHSSLNLAMGCDGCELWSPQKGILRCYAGREIEGRKKGLKGWPASFNQPELFTYRLKDALKWGQPKPAEDAAKPWLAGWPRIVFLNDLSDTATKSLPLDWLVPSLDQMEAAPYIWLIFTKRPKRLAQMVKVWGRVPSNFWLITTITSQMSEKRGHHLLEIDHDKLGISFEPLLGDVTDLDYLEDPRMGVAFVGGDSDRPGIPMHGDWVQRIRLKCEWWGTAFFMKQWGAWLHEKGMTPEAKAGIHLFDSENIHIWPDNTASVRVGKHNAGKHFQGKTWINMPEQWNPGRMNFPPKPAY